jgi:hypothetical protein
MRMQRNYDDYDENTGGGAIPSGTYMFEIVEHEDTVSKAGDVMINITLRCIEEQYNGKFVWDRILLPLPNSEAHKIIGKSKRFLHCIGEPYQGNFEVNTDNWDGKILEAKIVYVPPEKSFNGKEKNDIVAYNLIKDINQSSTQPRTDTKTFNNNAAYADNNNKDDDLPF